MIIPALRPMILTCKVRRRIAMPTCSSSTIIIGGGPTTPDELDWFIDCRI